MGRGVAGRGAGAAGGSGGVGWVLSDPALLEPIAPAWEAGARARGRPTISMATFVRLMVIKQRTGWGYETLVREVSDSMHLRRFCLIALGERVPDESTVRKLTRRLGAGVVNEITRVVIEKASGRSGFVRGRRGSTRRWWRPTCAIRPTRGWRWSGPGAGARGAQAAEGGGGRGAGSGPLAGDRPAVRAMSRTLGRRTGEAQGSRCWSSTEQAGS